MRLKVASFQGCILHHPVRPITWMHQITCTAKLRTERPGYELFTILMSRKALTISYCSLQVLVQIMRYTMS